MSIDEKQIRENIRRNIIYYRKKNKLTQKQLAEMLDMKNSSVSNWEQGANTPDIETLFQLCQIFKIDVNEMYGCDIDNSIILNDLERQIILKYRNSDEITKAMVLRALSINESISEKRDGQKMA